MITELTPLIRRSFYRRAPSSCAVAISKTWIHRIQQLGDAEQNPIQGHYYSGGGLWHIGITIRTKGHYYPVANVMRRYNPFSARYKAWCGTLLDDCYIIVSLINDMISSNWLGIVHLLPKPNISICPPTTLRKNTCLSLLLWKKSPQFLTPISCTYVIKE